MKKEIGTIIFVILIIIGIVGVCIYPDGMPSKFPTKGPMMAPLYCGSKLISRDVGDTNLFVLECPYCGGEFKKK